MEPGELAGFTVGITADRRRDEQEERLRRRGAAVRHGAAIRTVPLVAEAALAQATAAVLDDPPDVVLATTGIGVRAWLAAAEAAGSSDALVRRLQHATVLARGPKVAAALHQVGVHASYVEPT